jgi:hypothetical protein
MHKWSVVALAAVLWAPRLRAQELVCHQAAANASQRATQGSTIIRCERAEGSRAVLGWSLGITGGLLAGAAITFQVLAVDRANRLTMLSEERDPVTGLPLISYTAVASVEHDRQIFQGLAIGLFAGAGAVWAATVAAVLWPRSSGRRVGLGGPSLLVLPAMGGPGLRLAGRF